MNHFIDLHCHWVSGIDDGARNQEESAHMLSLLYEAGFSLVIATPHMRTDLFPHTQDTIKKAYRDLCATLQLETKEGFPKTGLACEHYVDDVIITRLMKDEGLHYPRFSQPPKPLLPSVLLEFDPRTKPLFFERQVMLLKQKGLRTVIAHPERYHYVWDDDAPLDLLLDAGAYLLLDVCSLAGKYGEAAKKTAEKLLEDQAYEAACTDSHRPHDVELSVKSMDRLQALVGDAEARRLFVEGPQGILG